MCTKIVVNLGELEIQSVKQFKEYFKVEFTDPSNIDSDCCLCQIDVGAELIKLKIPYAWDFRDYYVGEGLEKVGSRIN